jgi:hypothetical protein
MVYMQFHAVGKPLTTDDAPILVALQYRLLLFWSEVVKLNPSCGFRVIPIHALAHFDEPSLLMEAAYHSPRVARWGFVSLQAPLLGNPIHDRSVRKVCVPGAAGNTPESVRGWSCVA